MPRTRSTILIGALALVVIGALVWFIATRPNLAPTPAPTTAAPSTATPAPAPEPELEILEPTPSPSPSPSPSVVNIAADAYTRSTRWGPTTMTPPELDELEQTLVDVACAHISLQFTFNSATTSYEQILDTLAPFTDPDLLDLAYTSAATDGPPSDFDLWVRENATVTTTCAGAPYGHDPKPVTTATGEEILARAILTRPIIRMTPHGGQVEQTYPQFLVYVAPPDATSIVRVVWVDYVPAEGHQHPDE